MIDFVIILLKTDQQRTLTKNELEVIFLLIGNNNLVFFKKDPNYAAEITGRASYIELYRIFFVQEDFSGCIEDYFVWNLVYLYLIEQKLTIGNFGLFSTFQWFHLMQIFSKKKSLFHPMLWVNQAFFWPLKYATPFFSF